jgi:hypothetical protein
MSGIKTANRSISFLFIVTLHILLEIQVGEIRPELRHLDRNVGSLFF